MTVDKTSANLGATVTLNPTPFFHMNSMCSLVTSVRTDSNNRVGIVAANTRYSINCLISATPEAALSEGVRAEPGNPP